MPLVGLRLGDLAEVLGHARLIEHLDKGSVQAHQSGVDTTASTSRKDVDVTHPVA